MSELISFVSSTAIDVENSCRAVSMSIRDADIGKVHNQVKSPWFLEVYT